MLRAVEAAARDRGCVKVTLEVQENNRRARQIYERAGFGQGVYGDATGGSLFYSKMVGDDLAAQLRRCSWRGPHCVRDHAT
jgi:ribosomal protein S18 acetylase RimI-like enzyme